MVQEPAVPTKKKGGKKSGKKGDKKGDKGKSNVYVEFTKHSDVKSD